MKYYVPTKVYEEADCVKHHAADIAKFGRTALIVTGRHSAKACGALDDVIGALEENGQSYAIFDEVEENPSRETVMKGRDQGLEVKADFVIAIGGGSPLDAGKAIALMIAQPEEGIDYLYTRHEAFHILPFVAIPTTCGTGSEATGVSVLTNHEKKTKGSIPYVIFPDLSLMDARYLTSLSHRKICDTAVDALAHLIESWLSASATDFSRIFVREGLKAWGCNRAVLSGEKEPDLEDYRNLLYASCMGGMAIAHTGTSVPHGMSYGATYEEHISHGRACGYYLTGFMRASGEDGCKLLPQMAGFADIDELEKFVFEILEMTKDEISVELRQETARKMAANTAKLKSCSFALDEEMLKKIAFL